MVILIIMVSLSPLAHMINRWSLERLVVWKEISPGMRDGLKSLQACAAKKFTTVKMRSTRCQ